MKSFLKKILVTIITFESKLVLKKYKPSIIAVTGSVGKTSTKDAIYTALKDTIYVRKSEKSFNSEIGVPLTILGCPNGWDSISVWLKNILQGIELVLYRSDYPKCLVLEVGADHPGDIKKIVQWLKTDIVVITKVSDVPVHVEFFNSPEQVFEEKISLLNSLKKDGVAIISADDQKLYNATRSVSSKIMTFGLNNSANVSAISISNDIHNGLLFTIKYGDTSENMIIKNVLGKQHVFPFICAVAVGISRGLDFPVVIQALKGHIPPCGRMNIVKGINDSIIIDDTYNSSPDALAEALDTLSSINIAGIRKIAVLGDMMELGKYSVEEHRKAGERAIKSCDILITVGPRAKNMSRDALHFDNSTDAGDYLRYHIEQGDIILFKGSQSMRMERAVRAILAEPERANELLVRQESTWLAKK